MSEAPETSPFAAPAQPGPAAPTPTTAEVGDTSTSPFAAPAQPDLAAPPTPTNAAPDYGDTSFLDDKPTREPLIRSCTVPGVVRVVEPKENPENGKQSIFIAVQLYGEKMVNEVGDPVPSGKRLTTTLYAPLDTPEKKMRSEDKVRNLLLALNNVSLDNKQDKITYASWPPERKLGLLKPDPDKGRTMPKWSFHALLPGDKWDGTKVMVQVGRGQDLDGNPRNEFNLLAASTKPTERKGR